MKKRNKNITLSANTVENIKNLADKKYNGNFSLACDVLLKKALKNEGAWIYN